jgi:imidazolonepropionase-like amidohydrolase
MTSRPTLTLLLCAGALLCATPMWTAAQTALVISDVTVIDATGAGPRPHSTVILVGDRIDAVVDAAAFALPRGARVIPGRGKFLIPGLWDMHVHLSEHHLPRLVAYGVTGVRDMGNMLADVDRWRGAISAGVLVGPQIFRVGPTLNGKAFGPVHVEITNAQEARAAARLLKHVGVDAIKTHRALPREAYFALIDEAKKVGIPLVGHIPQTVTAQEASDAGQASFEHMETLFEGTTPLKAEEAPALFQRFVKNGNRYAPVLVQYRGSTEAANIDPELLRKYPDLPAGRKRIFNSFLELVGHMNRAGVILMTGTDLGAKWISPGTSLHEELALLVDAGLTPMQALQAGTRNPARFLGLKAGTVEPGMAANLILLNASPLVDIRNSRQIHAVILRGEVLDSTRLRTLSKPGAARTQ